MNPDMSFNQRKIQKNYRSITGHFPSVKNNKSIAFESKLESFLFLTLEFDDSVVSYQEQPQIEILVNSNSKIYSADCYIKRVKNLNKKNTIVEAKYTSDLEKNKDGLKDKLEAAKIAANSMNLDFEIFTEENFTEVQLFNLDFLYRYKLNPLRNKYEEIILERMGKLEKIKAKDLSSSISSSLSEYSIISNTIWSLVANGDLNTNIDEETLSMNSYVEKL